MRTIAGVIFFALIFATAIVVHRGAVSEWAEVTGYTPGDFYSLATRSDWLVYHRPRLIVVAITVVVAVIIKKIIWK